MGRSVHCNICKKGFKTLNSKNQHRRRQHGEQYSCRFECGRIYRQKRSQTYHERTCESNPTAAQVGHGVNQQYHVASSDGTMTEVRTAHNGNYKLFRKEAQIKTSFKENLEHIITTDVSTVVKNLHGNNKFCIAITVIFQKVLHREIFSNPPIYFTTTPTPTTKAATLTDILDGMGKDLYTQIEAYTQNGSGWRLYEIRNVDVQVSSFL